MKMIAAPARNEDFAGARNNRSQERWSMWWLARQLTGTKLLLILREECISLAYGTEGRKVAGISGGWKALAYGLLVLLKYRKGLGLGRDGEERVEETNVLLYICM
jgi:hypothetical protein